MQMIVIDDVLIDFDTKKILAAKFSSFSDLPNVLM